NLLAEIMRNSGFQAGGSIPIITPKTPTTTNVPTIPGKGPIYTKLAFAVQAHGTLRNLVDMMTRFYKASLLHQIKNLSIVRSSTSGAEQLQQGELDINFTIEALVLSNAEKRKQLLPGMSAAYGALELAATLQQAPAGLAAIPWALGPTGPL